MAKDPAFLFYPGDWLGGTMGMTFEEKGAYFELLMLQFNRGHMTTHIIGQTVGQLWDKIKDKFTKDEDGLWYNKRLEVEKDNRKSYTNSRKNNKLGNNQHTKKTGHMSSHMEDENKDENENINKEGGAGEEKYIVPKMCKIWYDTFPAYSSDKKNDFAAMGSILWFIAKQHHLKQVNDSETQEKILATLQQIANEVAKDTFWVNKSLKSISSHIQEFYNKIKNPTNGQSNSTAKSNGYHSKTAGQEVFANRLKDKLSGIKP